MNRVIVCCPATGASAVGTAQLSRQSCSDRGAGPLLGAIKLTQFRVAEENTAEVSIHLSRSGLLIAEHFADENPALMPAEVPAVDHPPRLGRPGILNARYPAGNEPRAGHDYVS